MRSIDLRTHGALARGVCQLKELKRREGIRTSPKQKRAWDRQEQERLRLEVIDHYSKGTRKCTHCAYDNIKALCVDHIHNNGAEERHKLGRASQVLRYLRKNKYPEGYQILCHNCNVAKQIRHNNAKKMRGN